VYPRTVAVSTATAVRLSDFRARALHRQRQVGAALDPNRTLAHAPKP